MKIKCDCGQELALRKEFFGDAHEFWKQHGHFPGRIEFLCDCGASLVSGPESGLMPVETYNRDFDWYLDHEGHRIH